MRSSSQCESVTLVDLAPGQSAEIVRIETGDGIFKRRLASLGLVPGMAVVLDRTAPMGDPRIYRLMGASLGLRNDEARCIHVSLK